MKQTLSLVVFLAFSLSAQGQGRVHFSNTSLTLASTNSTFGGPATGAISGAAGSFYFGLFSAPPGTIDPNAFTFTGAYATNTSSPGRLNGGDAEIPGSTGANSFALIVRGWSANIGHDWSEVLDYLANPVFESWYGESQIGAAQPTQPEGPYPSFFGNAPGSIPGFTLELHPAPEPTWFALAGLGAATLWFFRRRSL